MTDISFAPGGAFLLTEADSKDVFIPEEFGLESRLMAKTADEFLRKEVLPYTERIEAHDVDLMHELMKKAGAIGLLGADVPEIYGGLGLDIRTSALLAEKVNWQQSFALTHEAHTVIATLPLLFFGNHAQKAKFLPKLASGEWIGCFCLSEAGSGSDALGAQTRATLSADGSHYVLNGVKMWITNTAFASLFTVFAKVDGEKFSTFLVERDRRGVSFGKEEHKLGMKGASTRRVILDNVKVPVENLVGEVGKGRYAAFCALNMGRFKLEAGAVGGLKETLAVCAVYAKQRKQFGRPISDFGLIQHKLGEIAARLFALESAVYRLAGLLDGVFEGIVPDANDAPTQYHRAAEEYAVECCVVKVIGSELYSWATDEAIQIHGGYGYTEEFPVARAWRDQRLLRIGEGANEIVRLALVNTLLRRGADGRLGLDAALVAATNLDPWVSKLGAPPEEIPGRLKATALALLALARSTFGKDLLDEQEVVACIADLISAAFVAESAWLRAKKLATRGIETAALAEDAVRLYTESVRHEVWPKIETVLARLHASGMPLNESELILHEIMLPGGYQDAIGLRRKIAAAVLEREGYPW
jgi:alkylation response protein AidB-like acyl-CoA dehydrogenase